MPQKKSVLVSTIQIEEIPEMNFEEFCEACGVSSAMMEEIIDYGTVEPVGDPDDWRFDENDLRRIQTILRLQQDLEVNVAGAALVVDLIEELERLRTRMEVLEKYFNTRS